MNDPIPIVPTRVERRGQFPEHSDIPRRVLTAQEARDRARRRFLAWLQEEGH